MVAALGMMTAYRNRTSTLILTVVVWALYNAQVWTKWKNDFYLPLFLGGALQHWGRLLTFFLAGMCYYLYREKITYNRIFLWLAALALAISCSTNSLALPLPICGSYLLFYFAFHPKIHLHQFGRKHDLSYGIYLYGWPIQQFLLKYFFAALNPITLFLCALPLSCGAAYLSWTLIEKPFLKLKPRPQAASHPS